MATSASLPSEGRESSVLSSGSLNEATLAWTPALADLFSWRSDWWREACICRRSWRPPYSTVGSVFDSSASRPLYYSVFQHRTAARRPSAVTSSFKDRITISKQQIADNSFDHDAYCSGDYATHYATHITEKEFA
jgi:hypothetical protein